MIWKKASELYTGNGLLVTSICSACLTGYVQSPGVITDWYIACTTSATSGTKDELWGPHVSQPMVPDLQPHSMCSFTPILWRCGQLWCKPLYSSWSRYRRMPFLLILPFIHANVQCANKSNQSISYWGHGTATSTLWSDLLDVDPSYMMSYFTSHQLIDKFKSYII